MLRYLDPSCPIDETAEQVLAVCIIEGVAFSTVASTELQSKFFSILTQLDKLDPILQREIALSSLEDLLQ